ncbi:hypothetical protein B0H11DRAFT_1918332 [Mycena galericulata]|nr:hypothetical protein B0H11DRAFT_1918332 [Mycena galericulata]
MQRWYEGHVHAEAEAESRCRGDEMHTWLTAGREWNQTTYSKEDDSGGSIQLRGAKPRKTIGSEGRDDHGGYVGERMTIGEGGSGVRLRNFEIFNKWVTSPHLAPLCFFALSLIHRGRALRFAATYLLNIQTRRKKNLDLEKKWMEEGELGENDDVEDADMDTETLEMDGEDLEMDNMEEEDEAIDSAEYFTPSIPKKRKVSFRVESDNDDEAVASSLEHWIINIINASQ